MKDRIGFSILAIASLSILVSFIGYDPFGGGVWTNLLIGLCLGLPAAMVGLLIYGNRLYYSILAIVTAASFLGFITLAMFEEHDSPFYLSLVIITLTYVSGVLIILLPQKKPRHTHAN